MAQTDIESALTMDHLKKPTKEQRAPLSEVKEEIEAKANTTKEVESDPREAREYTWRFEYKAPDGTVYRGLFTNQIIDLGTRLKVAQLESTLLGGVNYHSVDDLMGSVAKAIAHMEWSLKAREQLSPKDWAKDFRDLHTSAPLLALYEEVMAHEATFLGMGKNSGAGEESKE